MKTLLLIRDRDVAEGVGAMLERENFTAIRVHDAGRGFDEALAKKPHLLLVELPLEGGSSGRVFERATNARTPMIVLSEVADEEEMSLVLDRGADDYVVKPFSPRELLARIRAVLRRTSGPTDTAIRFGEVEVNFDRRTVARAGREIAMSQAEYSLLAYFLRNAGRSLHREEILGSVWGYESFTTRTVDVHVAKLRGKLEPSPAEPRHILTIPRVGYRFEV